MNKPLTLAELKNIFNTMPLNRGFARKAFYSKAGGFTIKFNSKFVPEFDLDTIDAGVKKVEKNFKGHAYRIRAYGDSYSDDLYIIQFGFKNV